jgi:adenine-specific DNA methylase
MPRKDRSLLTDALRDGQARALGIGRNVFVWDQRPLVAVAAAVLVSLASEHTQDAALAEGVDGLSRPPQYRCGTARRNHPAVKAIHDRLEFHVRFSFFGAPLAT